MKTFDVTALGEALIDFTQNGRDGRGSPVFAANPGGAPCNVLALLQNLGRRTAFIGKVGADSFGRRLCSALEGCGICAEGLVFDPAANTTLAFVSTDERGERGFSFYRAGCADTRLRPEELNAGLIEGAKIFHFGTLSLTDAPARDATEKALDLAEGAGALVSLDPNLRFPLWRSAEEARKRTLWALSRCDVLKISHDELEFVTSEKDAEKGAAALLSSFPRIRLLFVTAGAGGSFAFCGGARAYCPAFGLGGVIDTTGAGDAFCAAALDFVLEHGADGLSEGELFSLLRFANAAAYLVTTKKGAMLSMPHLSAITALCQSTEKGTDREKIN